MENKQDHELHAIASMSNEDRDNFKKLGMEMFGHNKFKGVSLVNNSEPPEDEVTAFVTRQLDDGIHPSFLEEGEIKVLETNFGNEWYKKWGYEEGDLTEIITLNRSQSLINP